MDGLALQGLGQTHTLDARESAEGALGCNGGSVHVLWLEDDCLKPSCGPYVAHPRWCTLLSHKHSVNNNVVCMCADAELPSVASARVVDTLDSLLQEVAANAAFW